MFNPRLPRLLRQLQTRGAQIQVSLSTGNVQSLLDDVTGYRIDIAVIRGPVAVAPEELVVRPFVREKIKLALYSQHPLANSSALSLASLKNEKWLSLRDPQGVGFEHSFKNACRIAGIAPQVVQNVGDVPTLISLISAGLGIALVPASASQIRLDNVVYLDLLDRLEESELVLVYRRIIRSEVVKKFLLLVRADE
jgi:DNA-binding transcriptional LysR family regulator